jgi:uncharacterized protein
VPESDGICPFSIDRPVMRQRWVRLTFLHWAFGAGDVQRLLPDGLTADVHDGMAWVGLVPFFMRVGTPGGREVPWASRFCETNVRTYVRDSAGRPGIWFFSLEAARLGAVTTARSTLRLPYFWSAMDLDQSRDGTIRYRTRRRLPGPRPAASDVTVRPGARLRPGEVSDRDHFLTARWVLFSVVGGHRLLVRACHQPWPLHRADVLALDDHLIEAAGLPVPSAPPVVHYSPGVDVAIGFPERG